eukprot:m.40786 g.40786  ORF g.40786 m.40786 type:complete len:59 (-) comp14011_c0_seq1:279-455(-)
MWTVCQMGQREEEEVRVRSNECKNVRKHLTTYRFVRRWATVAKLPGTTDVIALSRIVT